MTQKREIKLSDFTYELPKERIPKYPLEDRSASKLLVFKGKETTIDLFKNLSSHLRGDELLVYNNAKVIPARMYFQRATGAQIEILLMQPYTPANYDQSFNAYGQIRWECMIGNLKKWKDEEVIYLAQNQELLSATLINRDKRIVEFKWSRQINFQELLEKAGELPIPPYLERETELSDYKQYQTIFAQTKGSVAAPTAGLHFTDEVLADLKAQGVQQTELTLHVGAGTFLPIKTKNVLDHAMHREFFEIELESLKRLIKNDRRIAVGTTSLRVLESLYYMGLRLVNGQSLDSPTAKLEPYEVEDKMDYKSALMELVRYMEREKMQKMIAATEILILPHYSIKSIKALITNFHLPESTLLLLVASVVKGNWKAIYQKALENEFRFLSYGDSSLLFCE